MELFIDSTKNELFDQLLDSIDRKFGDDRSFSAYQDDPVGFGEKILGETYTDEVKVLMESVRDHPVTIAKSPNAVGKCCLESEIIQLADGRVRQAGDLVGKCFQVLAFALDGSQVPARSRGFDNGVQNVFRVTTDKGRSIVRTGNHPLFAGKLRRAHGGNNPAPLIPEEKGWVPIEELRPDDILLVPTTLNITGKKPKHIDEVKLAAFLLGDASTTINISFTQNLQHT